MKDYKPNPITEEEKAKQLERLIELESSHDIESLLHECSKVHSDVLSEFKYRLQQEIEADTEHHLVSEEELDDADTVFKQITEFFNNSGWRYNVPDKNACLAEMSFTLKHTRLDVYTHVDPISDSINICVTLPIVYEEKQRLRIGNTLLSINEHLRYGSFKLNSVRLITFEYAYPYTSETFDIDEFSKLFGVCLVCSDVNFDTIYNSTTECPHFE